MQKPVLKCLAVMLFHNDEDLVEDQIEHMTNNNHDIIIFDHCSTDGTRDIIEKNRNHPNVKEIHHVGPEITFNDNGVFEYVSNILIKHYSAHYDWISFIESDEFLEGPDRTKNYYEHLVDVDNKKRYNWIAFDNYVFWFTEKDDITIKSPRHRIKYYSYKKSCATRVYAWKAKYTNIRRFNHNLPENQTESTRYPLSFKTCHYEMRSCEHAKRKLEDRMKYISAHLESYMNPETGKLKEPISNLHYKIMYDSGIQSLLIQSKDLYYDNGEDELIQQDTGILNVIYDTAKMRKAFTDLVENDSSNKKSNEIVKAYIRRVPRRRNNGITKVHINHINNHHREIPNIRQYKQDFLTIRAIHKTDTSGNLYTTKNVESKGARIIRRPQTQFN